jgi:hypothetical protein
MPLEKLSLARLRQLHASLFHPTQDWFRDQPFFSRETDIDTDALGRDAVGLLCVGGAPLQYRAGEAWEAGDVNRLMPAVLLASLYVRYPQTPLWRHYLWTADTDRDGQRVYLGQNGRGLEIHRHLNLTDRWGVPTWGTR